MPPTEAGKMLREAAELVDGPRETDHGDKRKSFEAIARAWNCYLTNLTIGKGEGGIIQPELTPTDVAQMMVLLKMTRPQFGAPSRDHFLDQCGYSGIAGMLAMEVKAAELDCGEPGGCRYVDDADRAGAIFGGTIEAGKG